MRLYSGLVVSYICDEMYKSTAQVCRTRCDSGVVSCHWVNAGCMLQITVASAGCSIPNNVHFKFFVVLLMDVEKFVKCNSG